MSYGQLSMYRLILKVTASPPKRRKPHPLPCSGNRTAELNKAIISLTCRQCNSKSCSAMQLSKLRQEGCRTSETSRGAITHKIKLNVIIDYWRKRVLCAFARVHSAFFIYSILSLYVNIKQGTKNKMFLCV